jgi:hypothetical protein
MAQDEDSYELVTRPNSATSEGHSQTRRTNSMETDGLMDEDVHCRGKDHKQLNRRTLHKLDFILLPFLCALFLLNSLDKSNIGNAETAGKHILEQLAITPTKISSRFHARYRLIAQRSQHLACFLLRLLRRPAAGRGRLRSQIWYGTVCAGLHDSLGFLYAFARLRSQALATCLTTSGDRDSRSWLLSHDRQLLELVLHQVRICRKVGILLRAVSCGGSCRRRLELGGVQEVSSASRWPITWIGSDY